MLNFCEIIKKKDFLKLDFLVFLIFKNVFSSDWNHFDA